jgi:transglutaminase-like putative cysteine protease
MKLQVVHRTHYEYAQPVRECFNEARLQPTWADGQVCRSFLLKVLPPTRLTHYRDFHLNIVHLFEVTEPHSSLTVEATSVVDTTSERVLAEDLPTTPLALMADCAGLDRCYDFLQASAYVEVSAAVWRLALDLTDGVTDAWRAAQAVMRHVHHEFTYDPDATHVHTHMADALQHRRGVCQDFAHVMIGLCRALKIPARYASGYLYNGPAEHLRGAQASHAWVEVYLPGLGWRGLDPTNNRQPDEHYVKIGVGRDYADVSPLRGTYRGMGGHRMTVGVQIAKWS